MVWPVHEGFLFIVMMSRSPRDFHRQEFNHGFSDLWTEFSGNLQVIISI